MRNDNSDADVIEILTHILSFIQDDDGMIKLLSNLPLYRDGLNLIALGVFSIEPKIVKLTV